MSDAKSELCSEPDPAITEVLSFWFSLEPKEWFMESENYDEEIKQRFGTLVEKARDTEDLDKEWLQSANGSLAMIILLDQFTRNIYRPGKHQNPGLSWSGDAKALRISAESIAKGFDREIQQLHTSEKGQGLFHRYFYYMPFMHAEDLPSQIASVALFEGLRYEGLILRDQKALKGEEDTKEDQDMRKYMDIAFPMALNHRNCVLTCGRFPKRNEPLGRDHTDVEKKWLEEHPEGF